MLNIKKIRNFFRKSSSSSHTSKIPSVETILLERIYYIPPSYHALSADSFDSFDSESFISTCEHTLSLTDMQVPVVASVPHFLTMVKLAKELNFDISQLDIDKIQQNTQAILAITTIFSMLKSRNFNFNGKKGGKLKLKQFYNNIFK